MRIRLRFLIYSLLGILSPVYAQPSENLILFDIGGSISLLFDTLGPDGINYVAVFGLVTSAVYFAAHTSSLRSGSDTPPGIGLIAAVMGLISAYYVYINELDFVGIIAPYTLVLVAGFIALLMYNFIKNFEREEDEGNNLLFGGVGCIVFGLITSSLLDSTLAALASTMYSIGIICIALFVILKGKKAIGSAASGSGGGLFGGGSSGGSSGGGSSSEGSSGGGSSIFSRTPRHERAIGERAVSDLTYKMNRFHSVESATEEMEEYLITVINHFLEEIEDFSNNYLSASTDSEKIKLLIKLADQDANLTKALQKNIYTADGDLSKLRSIKSEIQKDVTSLKGQQNEEERISRNNLLIGANGLTEQINAHVELSNLWKQDLAFLEQLNIKNLRKQIKYTRKTKTNDWKSNDSESKIKELIKNLKTFESYNLSALNSIDKANNDKKHVTTRKKMYDTLRSVK